MDAIIIGTAMPTPLPGVASALATPLLGRPVVAYVLETLVAIGVQRVAILAGTSLTELSSIVGNGERWGLPVRLAGGPSAATAPLAACVLAEMCEDILVIYDDPLLNPDALAPLLRDDMRGRLCGPQRAYGWIRVSGAEARQCLASPALRRSLPALTLPAIATEADHAPLTEATYLDWCTRICLDGWHAHTLLLREIDRGVLVGPGARIGAEATLIGPCVVAAGAEIGARCIIGPQAYIGSDALICDDSHVHQAAVLDATTVVPNARITQQVLAGNVAITSDAAQSAPPVAQSLYIWEGTGGPSLTSACLAVLCALLTAPWGLLAGLLAGFRCEVRKECWCDGPGLGAMRTIARSTWTLPLWLRYATLGGHAWPLLWSVITRQRGWCGVVPRGERGWQTMSSQERRVRQYLGPGLLDPHRLLLARGQRERASEVYQFMAALPPGQRWRWCLALLLRVGASP